MKRNAKCKFCGGYIFRGEYAYSVGNGYIHEECLGGYVRENLEELGLALFVYDGG